MILNKTIKTSIYKMTVCSIFCFAYFIGHNLHAASKTQSKSVLSVSSSFYNQQNFENEKYQVSDVLLSNKYSYKKDNFLYHHDLGGLFQFGEEEQAYDLRLSEIYSSYRFKNNKVSIGRKKISLSRVDQEWDLCLVNPLFNHDHLNPEQMGLFGLHHIVKKNNFYLQSFVSYVHLPNQSPKFEVKDEKITSINPWFSLPPEQVIEQGGETPVRYGVTEPETSDVIFQGSLNLKLGYQSKANWFSLAYANKPSNDFHKMYLFSEELSTDDYFVQVEATTKRHQLYMADIGAKFDNTMIWLSYLKDSPVRVYEKDETWQETTLNEQDWLSMGISNKHFGITNLKLSASYIKRFDGEFKKETLLKYAELDSILSRSYFERKESVQLKAQYNMKINRTQHLSLMSRFEYSIADKSQLTTAKLKYGTKKLSMFAEGGIITADDGDSSSFFSKYKGNDYIQLGASYVF